MSARQTVPKYTLHKASGQARVRIAGKDHYLGRHGSPESRQEYAKLIGQIGEPERVAVEPPVPDEITVSEVVLRFFQDCEKDFLDEDGKPNPDFAHFRGVLKLLRESFGRLPMASLSGPHLKQLQQKMIDQDWSRNYCNSQLSKLKRFARWAVSEELCPPTVGGKGGKLETVDGLRAGKTDARETEPVGPVSDEVVEKTLPFLPKTVADLVRVIRYTAARGKEIRTLRIGDLVRNGETLESTLTRHKNTHRGHRRVIVFGPKATAILAAYLNGNPDEYVFSPRRSRQQQLAEMRAKRRTKVQPSQVSRAKKTPQRVPGEFYTRRALGWAIVRACERAFGMPKHLRKISSKLPIEERKRLREQAAAWRKEHCWHPHQLRHAAATEIEAKFDLELAQASLGHKNVDMTLRYVERNLSKQRSVMQEIG